MKAVWDRKGYAAKMGYGYMEICIYLSAGQRKYMSFGKATAMEWIRMQNSRELREQIAKYEEIVQAMQTLGEDMTIENFESHLDLREVVDSSKKSNGQMYNGHDQSSSFIEYMEFNVKSESISPRTLRHKTCVIEALKRFGAIITFADLTVGIIFAFDKWLRDGTRTDVTIHGYHKWIRKYTHQLRLADMIPYDPYDRVKFSRRRERYCDTLKEFALDGATTQGDRVVAAVTVDEPLAQIRRHFQVYAVFAHTAKIQHFRLMWCGGARGLRNITFVCHVRGRGKAGFIFG